MQAQAVPSDGAPEKAIHILGKMTNRKRNTNSGLRIGGFDLAKEADRTRLKTMMVDLKLQAEALTQKDLKNWRQAWQIALDPENPRRSPLYDI